MHNSNDESRTCSTTSRDRDERVFGSAQEQDLLPALRGLIRALRKGIQWSAGLYAGLLLALLSGLALPAAGANPLDTARLHQCLKGWESWGIGTELPYFPQLRAGNCHAEGGANQLNASAVRRLGIDFFYETEWFPRLNNARSSDSDEMARAVVLHFERLLIAKGYRRTEGVGALPSPGAGADAAISPQVVYERSAPEGIERVELRTGGSNVIKLILERRGRSEGVRLPEPDESFDFIDGGSSARWFALPGMVLISQKVSFDHQMMVSLTSNQPGEKVTDRLLRFPLREYVFQSEKLMPVGDVEVALREALKQAGWKLVDEPASFSLGSPAYRYFLRDRQLDVGIRAWSGDGRTFVRVTLADPSVWSPLVAAIHRFDQHRDDWEIAPQLDAAGKPSTRTRHEMFVYVHHTEVPQQVSSTQKILVTPIARDADRDAGAREEAQKAAHWTVEQLVAAGVDRRHIRLHDEVRPPRLQRFNVERGARVEEYTCAVRTVSRPDRTDRFCECRAGKSVLSNTPGVCP
jgi:uncharacterized protein (DUF736 family)